MSRLFLSLLLTAFLFFCFSQGINDRETSLPAGYAYADKIFHQAEELSDKAGDNELLQQKADSLYLKANIAFTRLIPLAEKEKNDSLGFFIRLRAGFILNYFDSLTAAKAAYLEAIALKQNLPAIADSFLFIPYLYTGGIYYTQNQFDSALLCYKKAEAINDSYKKLLPESERLYNRMGIMYYETGNYRQASNYFEKAVSLTNPADIDLLVNYKINIASMLLKQEQFRRAQSVYEELLSYDIYTDEINHNLGITLFRQQEYKKAIDYFRKVNYSTSKKSVDLFYNYAMAWSALRENDSADLYLQKAVTENLKWNGHKKNISYGLILSLQAARFSATGEYNKAAETLQEAILQFDQSFTEKDIYKNPVEFSGVWSYVNLFNALVAKAGVFESLYEEQKEEKLLVAALEAYRTAFKLAAYVEKTSNSDEVRFFISKIKYSVHSKPIDVSLQLYELTGKKEYLEDAYRFDQQNKASVLSANLQENEQKRNNADGQALLSEESSLKSAITRLLLKSSQVADTLQLQSIRSSIRDYEIQLGRLQEKMMEDPAYRNRILLDQIPAVAKLQEEISNKTALISYHLSDNELLALLIANNRFTYLRTPLSPAFFNSIDSFKQSLQSVADDRPYSGSVHSASLYRILIAPMLSSLTGKKRVIIIPDDELNYLPFEALQDEKGNYLVQKFAVGYRYCTALFETGSPASKSKNILAFAPFASEGYTDSLGTKLSALPASREEISNLAGKILADTDATKKNFLSNVNQYGIIHLATHASADNETPSRSFIAFHPSSPTSNDDYKLYAPEIYDMKLDSTDLVILSACETGAGQLIKGEGLMSLSRAFAYAGCPNIITSLWKAEDKTTAFITQRLHHYLARGLTKDKALQSAKLDLLNDKKIDPRFKQPRYWAHLIFIGNYELESPKNNWWIVALTIILGAVAYLFIKKIKPGPKEPGGYFKGKHETITGEG